MLRVILTNYFLLLFSYLEPRCCQIHFSYHCIHVFLGIKPWLRERFFARASDAIVSNFVVSPVRKGGYTCDNFWRQIEGRVNHILQETWALKTNIPPSISLAKYSLAQAKCCWVATRATISAILSRKFQLWRLFSCDFFTCRVASSRVATRVIFIGRWRRDKILRTVPTNSKVFFRGLLNMREKQILTSVIEIEKENWR